jgi:hypothetical protein
LWKPNRIFGKIESCLDVEQIFIFLTELEFNIKFKLTIKDVPECRRGTLTEFHPFQELEGVLLKPDAEVKAVLSVKKLAEMLEQYASEKKKGTPTKDMSDQEEVILSIDNSINAYRRLIVRSRIGSVKERLLMQPEDELREKQADATWKWVCNEDGCKRPQDCAFQT